MYYSVGEDKPSLVCSATDVEDGIVDCWHESGDINMDVPGSYEVVYMAMDSDGNVATLIVTYIVKASGSSGGTVEPSIDIIEFYSSTDNLQGEALKDVLYSIVRNGFVPVSYGDSRYKLQVTDVDPNDSSRVINIYSRESVPGAWDNGATWNREHVWPNAKLGVKRVDNSNKNIASDLHNLRASDVSLNTKKSDRPFSAGSGEAAINADGGFYPGDEDKGDVARILFYMIVMYPNLTLIDDLAALMDRIHNYEPEGAHMGMLQVLLDWHIDDPVDDFERYRNNMIYMIQKNRNPFIDKPELVSRLFVN